MNEPLKRFVGEVGKAAVLAVVAYVVPKVGDRIIARWEIPKPAPPVKVDTVRS